MALYTPMKRLSPWAVFVGAFPGASPMLGHVAATGQFGLTPGLLFAGQFMWQFPHFWAIAWAWHEDYARAGFRARPAGRARPLQCLPDPFVHPVRYPCRYAALGVRSGGTVALAVAVLAGGVMLVPAWMLYRTGDTRHARRLMFASFLYLPAVQLAYVLDRS